MGPTCEVVLSANPNDATLDKIDDFMNRVIQNIIWTKKGRHWEGWINERPIIVSVEDANDEEPASIGFAACCKSPEDFEMLRKVSRDLANLLGAVATEPIK